MPTSNYSRPLSGDVMSSGSVWESHREEMIARRRGGTDCRVQCCSHQLIYTHLNHNTDTGTAEPMSSEILASALGFATNLNSSVAGLFLASPAVYISQGRDLVGSSDAQTTLWEPGMRETDKSRDLHKDSLWIPFWENLFFLLYNANVEAYEIVLEIFYIIVTISSTFPLTSVLLYRELILIIYNFHLCLGWFSKKINTGIMRIVGNLKTKYSCTLETPLNFKQSNNNNLTCLFKTFKWSTKARNCYSYCRAY